jgi:hypothetical protein
MAYYDRVHTYEASALIHTDDHVRVDTGDAGETVDSSGYDVVDLQPESACDQLQLAVDVGADGRYHVLYTVHAAESRCELRYAVRENGAWTSESLWTVRTLGFVDLHIGASLEPVITYLDGTEVVFAARHGAEWTRTRLGTTSATRARVGRDSEHAIALHSDDASESLILMTIDPTCGERLRPGAVAGR